MWRVTCGVLAGIIGWLVCVAIIDGALRYFWPEYAAVEMALAFTLPMMAARLSMSGASSLVGGIAAAWVDRRAVAPLVSGIVLLVLFLPVHYTEWNKLPVWYHLTFFVSLPLLAWLGGKLVGRKAALASRTT